jgi:ribonuclease E
MPAVGTFALPLDSLQSIATGAGLQWVNSDPAKVASVQAAIAAEPAAIHVPRERPPLVEVDTGPLILVETKRSLVDLALPFEPPAQS